MALALLALGVGAAASEAARDRVPPTIASSLAVTDATGATISLAWKRSDDNRRVRGYIVYRSGAIVDRTSGTAYTLYGLDCGSAYALGVAAYDWAGNLSPLATIVSSTTACPDTTPPSTPTGLGLSATSTSLSLSWSPAAAEDGVARYGVYRDGVFLGTTVDTSAIFEGLDCDTMYALGVDAVDAAGNHSQVTTLEAATLACVPPPSPPPPSPPPPPPPPPPPTSHYPIRGVYDRDLSASGFDHEAAVGFNVIDSGPYKEFLDPLAARGLRAMIWLGGYDNATCSFVKDDEWVRTRVGEIAGHPAVAAYNIDDEPKADSCPGAPAQMKARSELVKSLDPGAVTFLADYKVEQLRLWAGTVDVIALVRYPCNVRIDGCDFANLDELVAEADRLGIRYWGVIQVFADDYYKLPTPEELHQLFVRWRETNMEGYLVFAWRYPDDRPESWLANHPELQTQLATENGAR